MGILRAFDGQPAPALRPGRARSRFPMSNGQLSGLLSDVRELCAGTRPWRTLERSRASHQVANHAPYSFGQGPLFSQFNLMDEITKALQNHYSATFATHGATPKGVDWGT